MGRRKKHDFRTLKLPIDSGWTDADERMFQACFTILGQFVEDELGRQEEEFENGDPVRHRGYRLDSVGDHNPKAIDLWLWYRDELPGLEKECKDDLHQAFKDFRLVKREDGHYVGQGAKGETKFPSDWVETVKDQKLRELMEVRRHLWT